MRRNFVYTIRVLAAKISHAESLISQRFFCSDSHRLWAYDCRKGLPCPQKRVIDVLEAMASLGGGGGPWPWTALVRSRLGFRGPGPRKGVAVLRTKGKDTSAKRLNNNSLLTIPCVWKSREMVPREGSKWNKLKTGEGNSEILYLFHCPITSIDVTL